VKKMHMIIQLDKKGNVKSVYEKSPTWPNGKQWEGSGKSLDEFLASCRRFYIGVLGLVFSYTVI